MMRRWVMVGLVMAALTGLFVPASAQRPDAPRYAQRGPYPVGTREFVIEDADRPLNATVWYPALNPDGVEETTSYRVLVYTLEGRAIQDAAPDVAHGPYPLVVFSHGSQGLRYQSLFFTEHLASWGFVVVAADHPGNTLMDMLTASSEFTDNIAANFAYRPLDVLRVIDGVDDLIGETGLVDMEQIAVAGHSFGGYTALSVAGARLDFDSFTAWCASPPAVDPGPEGAPSPALSDADQQGMYERTCWLLDQGERIAALRGLDAIPAGLWPATADPRVRAVVLMAPWNAPIFGAEGLAGVTSPTLIMVGSKDTATFPQRDAYPIYHSISSTHKALAVLENAAHYIFVDECPATAVQLGLYDKCSDAVWDMARAHDLTNHLSTAFLLAVLHGDSEAAMALEADAVDFTGVSYIRTP